MADYRNNPIMEWCTDPMSDTTPTWYKITDHGRAPLNISYERIENKQRMANGYMRRYTVAKKRVWNLSWDNLPSIDHSFLAGGQSGEWMQNFHDTHNGAFWMRLRRGSDIETVNLTSGLEVLPNRLDSTDPIVINGAALEGDAVTPRGIRVMITDFSKEVIKRGIAFDLWHLEMNLEEC